MMKASVVSTSIPGVKRGTASVLCNLIKRAVARRLESLDYGSLTLIDGDDCRRFGQYRRDEPHITLTIHDPGTWVDVAFRGGLGAGREIAAIIVRRHPAPGVQAAGPPADASSPFKPARPR